MASPVLAVSGLNSLHAVIYVSRATRATRDGGSGVIADILAASTRNNGRNGVTGALLACGGWFLQVLEGRRIDVEHTLRRIEQDPGHCEIRRIFAGPITQRAFPHWHMCASICSPTDEQIVRVLADSGKFNPAALDATAAMRLLQVVERLQGRSAPLSAV